MGSSLLMNNIYMERILWEILYMSDLLNSIQMQPQMENLFAADFNNTEIQTKNPRCKTYYCIFGNIFELEDSNNYKYITINKYNCQQNIEAVKGSKRHALT